MHVQASPTKDVSAVWKTNLMHDTTKQQVRGQQPRPLASVWAGSAPAALQAGPWTPAMVAVVKAGLGWAEQEPHRQIKPILVHLADPQGD